jgi:hypothetical protein
MKNGNTVPKTGDTTAFAFASDGLPSRKGPRPKTIIGPLHVQCNGHGDPKYLNQLLNDVLSWPYIESTPGSPKYPATVADPTARKSCGQRLFGIYERDGVCPSAFGIANDSLGVTPGMRPLGHR